MEFYLYGLARSAHEHGLWEFIQTAILISGVSILVLRHRSVPDLNFHLYPSRDNSTSSFPFKLCIDIDNRMGKSVVISSMYFISGKTGLRPDKYAGRDTQTQRLIVNFPSVDARSLLIEPDYLLRHGTKVSTYLPLDPAQTENDVVTALSNKKSGKLICVCTWVEQRLTHTLVQKV